MIQRRDFHVFPGNGTSGAAPTRRRQRQKPRQNRRLSREPTRYQLLTSTRTLRVIYVRPPRTLRVIYVSFTCD